MHTITTMLEYAAFITAALMLIAVAGAAYLLYRIVLLARAKGFYLIKIEDRAISPASITAYVALLATVVGGLWLAFTVAVSGSLDLQRLSLELARARDLPILDFTLEVKQFSQSADGNSDKKAVQFLVLAKNSGPRDAELRYDDIPLLVISSVKEKGGSVVAALPYTKIDCTNTDIKACSLTTWTIASIEPGGSGTFFFAHPGLPKGIYLAQFQLQVPKQAVKTKDASPAKPVLWSQSLYFEVT